MKKMRYIPLLTLASLLIACDNAANLKSPTFAKEGDEVNFTEFTSKFNDAANDSELVDLSITLGDRVMKASYSDYYLETIKRDKKEISKSEQSGSCKGEYQFDENNLVGKQTAEVKQTYKVTNQEGSMSATQNTNSECYYQFGKNNGTDGILRVNTKTQSYYTVYVGGSNKKNFDYFMRGELQNGLSDFSNYLPADNKAAREYLFYTNNNDTLFTYTTNQDKEETLNNYKLTTRLKIKAQLDLADEKQSFRISYEETVSYDYTRNVDNHLKGDNFVQENKHYAEYVISAKDVNVDKVDISNYSSGSSGY